MLIVAAGTVCARESIEGQATRQLLLAIHEWTGLTVLALIAIMGMLVLTIDVGGLLLKRRAMVNASDAAALAAAQSCADTGDSFTPESRADIYAAWAELPQQR